LQAFVISRTISLLEIATFLSSSFNYSSDSQMDDWNSQDDPFSAFGRKKKKKKRDEYTPGW